MVTRSGGESVLLIFDLDGTLYRTESSFPVTMRRIYKEFSVPAPPDAEIMAMVGEPFGPFIEWLIPQGFPVGSRSLADRIARYERVTIRERGELFLGVEDTVRQLREVGFRTAVCTNGDRTYADLILTTFGLDGLFDAVSTHEDDGRTKADMVRALLERFRPSHAFVVGDRYHDVEAGHANGCVVIGAEYGYAGPGELNGADECIEHFSDLPAVVEHVLESLVSRDGTRTSP
jgi:phosphoglycolate phosphatase